MRAQLRSIWLRFAGLPFRLMLRRLSRGKPRRIVEGIELVVAGAGLEPEAERFFQQTTDALAIAALKAPRAFKEFQHEVKAVLLWRSAQAPPYQRFQLAAIVPPAIGLETDPERYAVWLLYVAGLQHGRAAAQLRAEEFTRDLAERERESLLAWLIRTVERGPSD